MKHDTLSTTAALLSIVLVTLHLADDLVRGFEKAGPTLLGIPILVVWLYGTLALAGRRSGRIIVLLGSLLGMLVPVIHFGAAGAIASGAIARSGGAFFFVWTLIALGVCALFSFVLSVQGLARSRAAAPPSLTSA